MVGTTIDPKIHVDNAMGALAEALEAVDIEPHFIAVTRIAQHLGDSDGGQYIKNGHAVVAKGFLFLVQQRLEKDLENATTWADTHVLASMIGMCTAFLNFGEEKSDADENVGD